MYSSRKIPNISDDDSDFGSRYKSSSYGNTSARGSSRGNDIRDNFSRDNFSSRDNFTRDSAKDNFTRDSARDNFSRDTRDNFTRDSARDNYSRDSARDSRDTFSRDNRDSYLSRDNRDNFSRDSRDNNLRESVRSSRDNLSRDRDFRREPVYGRDLDKPSESKYGGYRSKFGSKDNSDSSDNEPVNRYGSTSRRVVRNSSDSDDSEKNDRRRIAGLKISGRPLTSSRKDSMPDADSYDGANQKLKMMLQWDKSLCEQLDDIYESKTAKEKKIEALKDEVHKDTIKEDGLRKKLSELRMNRKMLQSRLDEFK